MGTHYNKINLIRLDIIFYLISPLALYIHCLCLNPIQCRFLNQPIKLRGVVTKVEFMNPHSWIYVNVKKDDGSVDIVNTGAAGNPLKSGEGKPLLTIDVWEHAYYIDYRNARPKFVETFLASLANWDFAAKNFA